MSIEIKKVYNHMFFTEISRRESDTRNTQFFIDLDNITRMYPYTVLTIILDVKKDRHTNHYHEFLEFVGDESLGKRLVLEAYQRSFYHYPLEQIPLKDGVLTDAMVHNLE